MDQRPTLNNRNTVKRVANTSMRKSKPEWNEDTHVPVKTTNPKLKGLFSIVPPLEKGAQNSQTKKSVQIVPQRTSNAGLKSPQKELTKRSSTKSPSSVRKNPTNATELTLARLKHEMEGLVGQLKIQREESKELGYSSKVQNMKKLKEAHDHAVNTIMKYVQAAQTIVRQNNCSTTFRRELATLIQQLALYCAEIETDMQQWEKIKQIPFEDTSELARMYIQHSLRKHELTKQSAPFSPAASQKFITKLQSKSPGVTLIPQTKQPSAVKPTNPIAKRLFDPEPTNPQPPDSNNNNYSRQPPRQQPQPLQQPLPQSTMQTFNLDTIKTNLTTSSMPSTIPPQQSSKIVNAATLEKLRALAAFKRAGGTKVEHPSTTFLRKHNFQVRQHTDELVDYIIDFLCEDIVRELSEMEESQQQTVIEPSQPLAKSSVALQTDMPTLNTISTQISQNNSTRIAQTENDNVLFHKVNKREPIQQTRPPSRNRDVEEYQRMQNNKTQMAQMMKEDQSKSEELLLIEEELRKIYDALTITETKWKQIDTNNSTTREMDTSRTVDNSTMYNTNNNNATNTNNTLPKAITISTHLDDEIEEIEWSEDEKEVLEEVLEEEYIEKKRMEKLQYAEILTDYILHVAVDSVLMEFWSACDNYVEDMIKEEWGELPLTVPSDSTQPARQSPREGKTTDSSTETADL